MKLFERHESCVGLRLWKWNQLTVHVWYCPKGYVIEQHSHEDQDIELMFVKGEATFYKLDKNVLKAGIIQGWGNPFKLFSIPAGTVHWFEVSNRALIFINFARWKVNTTPTSAAVDFKKVILT